MARERKRGKIFYRSVDTGAMRMKLAPSEMQIVSRSWSWALFMGILMVIIGIFAVIYPIVTSVGVVLVLGLVLLAAGIVQLINSFYVRHWESVVWHLVLAATYGIVGVLLLVYPLGGLMTLALLLSVYLLVSGIVKIILALVYRAVNWGWTLFSGIVSVVLAGLIWFAWPTGSLWFIGLLVGLDLIINGLTLSAKATSVRGMISDAENRTIR